MSVFTDLRCARCQRAGKDFPAWVTIHDKRGCQHFCGSCAAWRLTTSLMFGHSSGCRYHADAKRAP